MIPSVACAWLAPWLAIAAPTASEPAETAGGWIKFADNPVLGGSHGTCFDVSVLNEDDKFRMWFSWRAKKSIGMVESADGTAGASR